MRYVLHLEFRGTQYLIIFFGRPAGLMNNRRQTWVGYHGLSDGLCPCRVEFFLLDSMSSNFFSFRLETDFRFPFSTSFIHSFSFSSKGRKAFLFGFILFSQINLTVACNCNMSSSSFNHINQSINGKFS